MPDLVRSLYVHVPFCHTICGYCDFYSQVYDKDAAGPLVDALIRELDRYCECMNLRCDTVFVGGGTPTTLPAPQLSRLLGRLQATLDRDSLVEFTCEANPATVTPEIAAALSEGGVNRVSLGAQSFDRSELHVLERIHRPEQVGQTVRAIRDAGIGRINVDLIFAIPGQTLEKWLHNLRSAIDLGVDHLSCYGLTYERGTPLFEQLERGQVQRVDEELEARMYEATIDTLALAGYGQYEISNFARPGCECRHNLRYWMHEPYVGIGPSACGCIPVEPSGAPATGGPACATGDGSVVRYRNVPDTAAYARAIRAGKSTWIDRETRSLQQQARDAAWLGLRTRHGIDPSRFQQRFHVDVVAVFGAVLRKHAAAGLVEITENSIRLTRRGLLLANQVSADLLAV